MLFYSSEDRRGNDRKAWYVKEVVAIALIKRGALCTTFI